MTASDPDALRDEVGRRLARLVEITRIIDRNTDDKSFVRSVPDDSEVIYVLDTNTVRLFFEPFQNPQYAELFHAGVWGNHYNYYDHINRESCLLISEYLLSGVVALPGQRRDALYMSTVHHHELIEQMRKIRKDLKEKAEQFDKDPEYSRDIVKPVAELNMLSQLDPERDRERFIRYAESQAPPGEAGRVGSELRQLSAEDFKERAALIRLRQFCILMARDRTFEPLHQLRRFSSAQIAGRFQPIEQKFRANAAEQRQIDRDAEDWRAYLDNAFHERQRRRATGERAARALQNDAKTLAHLIWAQKNKAQRNQRIVLVTGDKLLYDTYRRRHSETDDLPFLMRPLTQYAPLFNPSDAASAVADREATFKRVRSVIEVATVSLNLNLFRSDHQDARMQVRIRDHFILDAEKSITSAQWALARLYPKLVDNEWLAAENRKFDDLVSPLQDIERLMLGVFPNLIAPRLDVDRTAFLEAARQGDNSAFVKLFRDETGEVEKKAFEVSVPFMGSILQALLSKIRAREQASAVPRAALAVRLRFQISSEAEQSFAEVIGTLRSKSDNLDGVIEVLVRRPSRVFALTALLTFSLEQWDEAARYAELAANASETANRKQPSGANGEDAGNVQASNNSRGANSQDEHYEYLYLQAASLRFRSAAVAPDPEQLFHDPWALWRANADAALTACLRRHDQEKQLSRQMRTLSERAAANLSYCAWFAFGRLGDIRVNQGHDRVTELLRRAVDDLVACDELRPRAKERAYDLANSRRTTASAEVFEGAKHQYRINIVAARYIAMALARKGMISEEELAAACVRLPDNMVISTTDRPTISRAYLYVREGKLEELHAINTAPLTLALDRAIIDGLKKLYPLPVSAGPAAD